MTGCVDFVNLSKLIHNVRMEKMATSADVESDEDVGNENSKPGQREAAGKTQAQRSANYLNLDHVEILERLRKAAALSQSKVLASVINFKQHELEIIDLINQYKLKNKLSAEFIGRGGAWLDTGTIDDFYKTSAFVSSIENRQGLKIACLEEIALMNKWIGKNEIKKSIKFYGNCEYSNYLKKIIS